MKIYLKLTRLIAEFHNNERGTVAILTIVAAIPLTLMMFYMVNSSKAIQDHTRAQDAADMIALVHAAEAARSLNTISMDQVTMTQAFASGVTAGTLYDVAIAQIALDTAAEAAIALWIFQNCKPLASTPPPPLGAALFAACAAPPLELAAEVAINLAKTVKLLNDYDPLGAFKVAQKTVKALNKKNEAIVNRFPEAVSVAAKQIAQSAKVTDIYFDNSCAKPSEATSCNASNKRQGMNLPVDKNKAPKANLTFCAALHFGTIGAGGVSLGPLSIIPGLSSLGATAMNGSYIQRKFPAFKGPMYGGKNNQHLRDFINDETGIGKILTKYYKLAKRRQLWGQSLESKYHLQWPYKQKKDKNIYTDWVTVKIVIQCGGLGSVPGLGFVLSFLSSVLHDVPPMDLYHPVDQDTVPTIQPGISDYSDAYKPLSFVYRKPNKRWAPKIFKDTNKGFYTYSEALVYNPDEIGLYSQNWRARLIPAKKMMTLSAILSRMGSKAPSSFSGLKTELQSVSGDSSWSELVAK